MIPDPITRFIKAKDVVTPYKTLEKASEEANDYDWMRAGENVHICQHGEQIYPLILRNDGDALEIACSCPAWQFAHDNDGCKHTAAFLKRSTPPQKSITDEIARDLMAAGWTGGKGDLRPPETTSDEDGEDNEGNDPVPDRTPKPTPAPTPEPGMLTGTCRYCGKKFERQNTINLASVIEDHEAVCPKRSKGGDITQEATKMEEKKTYTHPDGTSFESAEALLDYNKTQKTDKLFTCKICGKKYEKDDDALNCIEKCKAARTAVQQSSARRVRHKPMIKGISPQLQEIGRIAVGEKGGMSKSGKTRLPTKLDHFIFTTLNKDDEDRYIRDAEMMVMFGDNCTEIPIRLLYNDIELNFPTFYAKYARSGIKLRGDGENWTVYGVDSSGNGTREEVFDPNNEHGFLDDPDVKPHGILTVLVDGQDSVGGVFKFRTTSWNSINNILSSLALIKNMCGMLTYIPLKLVYRKKEVQPVGMAHKTWIPVVSVEFRGSIEELQTQAIEVRQLTSGTQREEMKQIEAAVRDHLDEDESADVQRDIASEFAPGVE